jgi:hypothetical protein
MQRVTAPGISSAEWRWVIIFSGLLVAITLLPYAWAFASDSPSDNWQFMGMLPNPQDGATYLAKIGEGARGDWLFTLAYTSEPHAGAAINEFYLWLGHLSRILGLSPLLMYHLSRLVTGFVMYISIYHLGSVIWPRLRPRRLFFGLIAVGSGLGWLALIFLSRSPGGSVDAQFLPTDFSIPESIPFFSTFVNPHFPLAIALIALLAATFVMVFRPGFNIEPNFTNGGASVALVSIALCIVQPQGWVPIAGALCVYILILTLRSRRIPQLELSWVLLVILPAIPFFLYYYAVIRDNGAMRAWNAQNLTPSPLPFNYIMGFGLLLVVALPGLWRGVRRFERDGDRLMLIWFVVNVIALYVPFSLQRRLAIGLIIPIVYFAVRALEDSWFNWVSPKWRDAALVALFVFIIPSNVLSLSIPLFGILKPSAGIQNWQLLPADYNAAIQWLRDDAVQNQVVLAPPRVSLWIPAYAYQRVVYGHPFETLNAAAKLKEVNDWYTGKNCGELLREYHVRYVLSGDFGALAMDDASDACLKTQQLDPPVATFGNVSIYEVR